MGELAPDSFRGALSLSRVGRPDLVVAFYMGGSYQVIGDTVAYREHRFGTYGGVPILGVLAGQPVVSLSYELGHLELYRLSGLSR